MRASRLLMSLLWVLLATGCASLRNGSEFQSGRQALLRGETKLLSLTSRASRNEIPTTPTEPLTGKAS